MDIIMIELYDNGKIYKNANINNIQKALDGIKNSEYSIILRIMGEPKNGPTRLDIDSNPDGFYLPVMSINGEERGLREFYNEELYGTPAIVIGGNEWDPTFLTKDYDRICRMVWEFYETGNVTDELLQ